MVRVDTEVAAVEQDVYVRPEEQPVVQPVLTTGGQRSDVRGLQNGPDLVAGNRASMRVRLQHHRLERLLAEPLRAELWISVDGTRPVPRLAHVGFDRGVQDPSKQSLEVTALLLHDIALALHDIGRKVGWRVGVGLRWEEPSVSYKDAPDNGIFG